MPAGPVVIASHTQMLGGSGCHPKAPTDLSFLMPMASRSARPAMYLHSCSQPARGLRCGVCQQHCSNNKEQETVTTRRPDGNMQRADCKQLPACAGHTRRKQVDALPRACSPDEHAGVARLRLDACDEHGAATQLEAHHGARDCAALWYLDSLPATTEQVQGQTAIRAGPELEATAETPQASLTLVHRARVARWQDPAPAPGTLHPS